MIFALPRRFAAGFARAVVAVAVFVGLQGVALPGQAQTIYAIVVADTNDPSIGVSVGRDLTGLTRMLQAAAGFTGMKLELQALSGNQVTLQNVRAAVQRVAAGPNDTVFFYYSGHGYRTWNKQTRFPYLFISQQGQDFGEIVAELRKRNPRLLIAVTDSCNEYADLPVAAPMMRSVPGARTPDYKRNYSRLWLEAQGEIIVASSSEGEYAWGDDDRGGFFTHRLLGSHESMVQSLDSSTVSWDPILTTARRTISVPAGGRTYVQTPIVEAKVSYRAPAVAAAPATPTVTATAVPAPMPAPQPQQQPLPAALPPKPTWVAGRANAPIPTTAVAGGQEQGRAIAICRAPYQNGVHPGRVVAQGCSIGWGGREVVLPQFEILTGDARQVSWVRAAGGAAPPGAYVGGQEPQRRLVVCRAPYQNAVYPGKLVAQNCNFSVGGREILSPQYEVLVAPQ